MLRTASGIVLHRVVIWLGCNMLQGAEASGGMVNIRADEDMTPEEVLRDFSEADADDVQAMAQDPQVSFLPNATHASNFIIGV